MRSEAQSAFWARSRFTLCGRYDFLWRQDTERQAAARAGIEAALTQNGLATIGWRVVPTSPDVCGEIALSQLPHIEQVFIAAEHLDHAHLAPQLFMARRQAEIALAGDEDFYISSLSDQVVSYKGLVMPGDLAHFYPDLNDKRLKQAFVYSISAFQQYVTSVAPRAALPHACS